MSEAKTFKVQCAHCAKPFHVRFPLARPNEAGDGQQVLACEYCGRNVLVTIPQRYIAADHLLRGLPSLPADP